MAVKGAERWGLLFLVLAGFALRLMVLIFWVDIPGDGPTRAIMAYNWANSPHISTHGNWLPGFMYLAGICAVIINDPLLAARILNLIIGTLTIPLFYALLTRVYGQAPALFGSSILAFLPLHIGLSASSLTEVSFLLEIIASIVLLIKATEKTTTEFLFLCSSLVCLGLAVMTRYEAWLLIPLFPYYYYWKTRKLSTAAVIAVSLLVFPGLWLISNYLYFGDLLPAFSSNTKTAPKVWDVQKVGLSGAVGIVAHISASHLGWILFLAITLGAIQQLSQAAKGKLDQDRVLYLMVTGIIWASMISFTMFRGRSLHDRFLLAAFIMALPIGVLPITGYLGSYRTWLSLVILTGLASVAVASFYHRPEVYVTRKQPHEIRKLAYWLKESPYRNDAILLTEIGWRSTYLALYHPQIGSRILVVSPYIQDSGLEHFLKNRQPSLLITHDRDNGSRARIERFLGWRIQLDRLVHREGSIDVYALKTKVAG
jgi:4-amino-4-deoxy-L-arabinose transferase-like glycosyltransferase